MRHARGVLGDDHVDHMQQRVVRVRRLLLPHIEPRAAEMAIPQRRVQRRLVMDVAARRGDEDRALAHLREAVAVHQAAAFRRQRQMQADHVALGQQLRHLHLAGAARRDRRRIQIGVAGQHGAGEAEPDDLRHPRADIADPDQPDRAVAQLPPHQRVAIPGRAGAHRRAGFRHPLQQRQHHADRVLRHALGIAAGLVHQQHAGRGAGGRVHRVVAGAGAAHHQQAGQLRQQRRGHVEGLRQLVA